MTNENRRRGIDGTFGWLAVILGLGAAACMLVPGVPWQLRFGMVAVATLAGPGIPGLRLLLPDLDLLMTVVLGVSVDVALLMVFGEAMLLVAQWHAEVAAMILLLATVAAGVGLLMRTRRPEMFA